MQRISSKTTKNPKPKSKKYINESNPKSNANYLSNRSKKCNTSTTSSICNTSSSSNSNNNNNNNKNNNKVKNKCIKSAKSKPVKNCNSNRRKMIKSGASSTSPTSKCKPQMTASIMTSNEDEINEMPILTPEVPFESDIDNDLSGSNNLDIPSIDVSLVDLVPPVLSPALDQESKDKSLTNVCNKPKSPTRRRKSKVQPFRDIEELDSTLNPLYDNNNGIIYLDSANTKSPKKRKSNVESLRDEDLTSLYTFSDYNSNNNEFNKYSAKKMKCNVKNAVNNVVKSSNKFLQKSIQKSIQKSKGKLYNNTNNNNNNTFSVNNTDRLHEFNESNYWSVNSNHTMTSSTSFSTTQPFLDFANNKMDRKLSANQFDCIKGDSILVKNNFDDNYKLIKPKLFKKSKSGFNSQLNNMSNKRTKKSLFNDLIGVKKPEAEMDEIEGIVFHSFETEDSLNIFSKFEMLEKEQQRDQSSNQSSNASNIKYKIKSFKSGKVIFPTKTKDITKIKGWREKLFSSFDQKQTKRSICKPLENSTPLDQRYNSSLLFNPTTAQTSKGSNSAFVSDILDGYLKNKSDLKLNYLSPDLAPPPDDSPIFSASVLKMPDFTTQESMPPPPNPSLQSTPNKTKGNFGRSKGLKNKLSLKTDFSDSMEFLNDCNYFNETSNSERFVPQFPIIRETLWSETPLTDDHLKQVYDDYIDMTYNEIQMMKKYNPPSFIMDDHYARYALSALQCNERIQFASDSNDNSDNVLMAVGLTPKIKELSPVVETKITGRYRKDREADLAKIIAMGNRSKRQIRLPSRFHESSLLMGNQWVIADYDQKGKTGKRRLQQEQKRLQELHQRQLELEQRNQLVHFNEQVFSGGNEDSQLTAIRSVKKKTPKNQKLVKSKDICFNIPIVPNEYPIKIPQQRLKQLQIMRNRKNSNKSTNVDNKNEQLANKSFTSLHSLATQTSGDRRQVSLSAKAAASASQRAVVNQLFYQLYDTLSPEKKNMFSRNGKINKLEVIKEAIETIEKLTKREQQLNYIRKLLSMWNHKLQLCSKVAQPDMKPEAYKVVNEVMNTYKSSLCYKVGEALESKRREFQQKRVQLLVNQNPKSSMNTSQIINIPISGVSNNANVQFKPPKSVTQRLILPKLSPVYKNILPKASASNSESIISLNNSANNYPKLTPPDLHQRSVGDRDSVDSDIIKREGSLLKPPLLTTRPTVLKPFIYKPSEGAQSSKSVTGPIINVPNISRIKSMTKSIKICNPTTPPLIASNKPHVSNTSLLNSSAARFKIPITSSYTPKIDSENHSIDSKNLVMGINAYIPIVSTSNITGVTSSPNVYTSNTKSQSRPGNVFNPHAYAGKSVIITSETPLASEDLSKIVASIAANPDNFKKVPVRLSNGLAALTIPGPLEMPITSKFP